jgi:hypothetical protein
MGVKMVLQLPVVLYLREDSAAAATTMARMAVLVSEIRQMRTAAAVTAASLGFHLQLILPWQQAEGLVEQVRRRALLAVTV